MSHELNELRRELLETNQRIDALENELAKLRVNSPPPESPDPTRWIRGTQRARAITFLTDHPGRTFRLCTIETLTNSGTGLAATLAKLAREPNSPIERVKIGWYRVRRNR